MSEAGEIIKCCDCKHLREGEGSDSPDTGYIASSASCSKGHWYLGDHHLDRKDLAELALKQKDCSDFEADQ